VSVEAPQDTFTWVHDAALALTLPGTEGAIVSGHAGVVAFANADRPDELFALSRAWIW
jgi:hypothetical protein